MLFWVRSFRSCCRRETGVTKNAEAQRLGKETAMAKWIGMTIVPAVTDRFRSLEGRPVSMSCSVMLPESARLRLLELGSSFVTALAEQRPPMTGLLIPQPSRRWWEALQEFEGAVRLVPRDHDAAKMLHHVRARLN
jgi:hypothetical protein